MPSTPPLPTSDEPPGPPADGQGSEAGRGSGTAGEGPGPDVVAVYSGGTVTRSQFDDYLASELGVTMADLEGTEEAKAEFGRRMLARMVVDEMMLREAERRGIGQQEGIRRALQHLAEDENIAEVAATIGARIEKPTQAEIAAYYEKHRELFGSVELASVRQLIADMVTREKARQAFEAYILQLKRRAAIRRSFRVLDSASAPPQAVVFSVNGRTYTVRQFRDERGRMTPEEQARLDDPKARDEFLEALVTRYLLLDAASTIADADTRKRIERIRRSLLLNALHREQVDRTIVVTDQEVAAEYEREKDRWQVPARARVALLRLPLGNSEAERQQANRLMAQMREAIAGGAGFEATADRFRAQCPGIEAYDRTRLIADFEHAADVRGLCPLHLRMFKTVAVGELSQPFENSERDGEWLYLIKVLEREERRTPRQDEIGFLLRALLWADKHEQAERLYEGGLLQRADLKIREEALTAMARGQATGTSSSLAGNR